MRPEPNGPIRQIGPRNPEKNSRGKNLENFSLDWSKRWIGQKTSKTNLKKLKKNIGSFLLIIYDLVLQLREYEWQN